MSTLDGVADAAGFQRLTLRSQRNARGCCSSIMDIGALLHRGEAATVRDSSSGWPAASGCFDCMPIAWSEPMRSLAADQRGVHSGDMHIVGAHHAAGSSRMVATGDSTVSSTSADQTQVDRVHLPRR